MAGLLTCPRGHRFDSTAAGANPTTRTISPESNSVTCPVCGAQCETSPRIPIEANDRSAEAEPTTFTVNQHRAQAADGSVKKLTASQGKSTRPPLHTIPGYEFLEKLGQGGMGVVFKARQTGLNRVVALKMILASFSDNPQELARFQIEAEALASLQHPNIVQVYDVGTYEDSPFFAMEFVDGGSLDRKLSGKPMPPREAAWLIELLARAMHAAHQRGIIHRDLKPVNVLLTKDGTPKIVDFGLAKRLEDHDDRTLPGAILGTPSYMAPEQAFGKSRDVGPATDVHALGVILYEMLAGKQPFRGDSALVTLENVRKAEPAPPSKLQPDTPRDLDVICLKCLQKDPQRRYASAEALANDLCRFRDGRPILARPVGPVERTAKWIRRRPALATLLALTLVMSVVAVASGIWHNFRLRDERDRAEKNFQTALNAVDEMLTVVAEEQLATEPHMEEKRRDLLLKAQEFYNKLLEDKQDDPAMRRHVALGHKRVGDIHRLLGENDKSEKSYDKAIKAFETLAAEYPSEQEPRQHLADCLVYRGEIWRLANKNKDAADAYDTALKLQSKLIAEFPGKPDLKKDLARTYYNLGILYKDTGKFHEAQKALQDAVDLGENLQSAYPEKLTYRHHLARSYLNLAPVVARLAGFEKGQETSKKAIDGFKYLIDKDPLKPDYQQELATCHNNLGNIFWRHKELANAEANYNAALELFQRLATDFPRVPIYRQELANTYNSLAALMASNKRLDEAVTMWKSAEKLQQQLVNKHADVPAYRGDLGMTRASLGRVYSKQKQFRQAKEQLIAATEDIEHVLATNPNQQEYLQAAQFAYVTLGFTMVSLNEDGEAVKQANRLVESFPQHDQGLVVALCFLASCYEAASQETPEAKARAEHIGSQAETIVLTALAKARAERFARQAESIILAALASGRTSVLAKTREHDDFKLLSKHDRIAPLMQMASK